MESGCRTPSSTQPSPSSSLLTNPAVCSLPRDDLSTSTVATEETRSESELFLLPDYLILSNCETGRLHHARYASAPGLLHWQNPHCFLLQPLWLPCPRCKSGCLAVASSSGCISAPLASCCRQGRARSLSTTIKAEACGTPNRMTHAFWRCGFHF